MQKYIDEADTFILNDVINDNNAYLFLQGHQLWLICEVILLLPVLQHNSFELQSGCVEVAFKRRITMTISSILSLNFEL